ncbi:MAG: methyltransferase domain-containing protein [Actinobacteria bacterium]|nr:methyltransferase domain-containing protein [Actinomycetota bacterium]
MTSSRWEEVAEDYNRIFRRDAYYYEIMDTITARLDAGEGSRILDMGCGTGNITALLRERFPQAALYGVDPADNMVELATDRFRDDERVEIRKGEGTRIPFSSEYFDYAVSNLALHHVLPELRSLCAAEIARVLKPGGRLVYSDLFWDVPGERDDPERCREVIDKIVAYALYNLELGALEMTLFLCEQLPLHLEEKAEYVTVVEDWLGPLAEAGLTDVEVTIPHHPEFGFKLIQASKPGL